MVLCVHTSIKKSTTMAKIKFGMMMTDARGKLGGQVFSKNRSGAIVRSKVTPTNPQTSFQAGVRALFGNLSQQWRNLTTAQRDAWNAAVNSYPKLNIFGDTYLSTGKNLFVGVNTNILNAGGTLTLTPPTLTVLPNPINITGQIQNVSELFTITPDDAITDADCVYSFEATAPSSPGKSNFSGSYRKFAVVALNALDPDVQYASYVDKFGFPPTGSAVSLRSKIINKVTGQVSQSYIDTELVLGV